MNHTDIRHKLSEYLDNAVSTDEQAVIEAHLATCSECSNALEELRKTLAHIKDIEEIEPPAWMATKIMAQVRAETKQEKSLFNRILRPLAINIPLQTVAVLFLAVTAYYLYQTINPVEKYAEPTRESVVHKQMPVQGPVTEKNPVIQQPAPQTRKLPQEESYKSLDMRYAYKKPAPPEPMKEAAAPAPSPAAPAPAGAGSTAFAERNMLRSAEPEMLMDKAELSAEAKEQPKAKAAAPMAQTAGSLAAGQAARVSLSLSVADIAAAETEVERVVGDLKGTVVTSQPRDHSRVITISLAADRMDELRKQLGRIGVLKESETSSRRLKEMISVELTLVQSR